MSKQRRDAINCLDETNSPFVPTLSQVLFKNTANVQLRGSTYDARHLDKFLGSAYGDKSFTINNRSRQEVTDLDTSVTRNRSLNANLPDYLVNSHAIKPSVSFLCLGRDRQTFNSYVDLQDGPSSLQKRPSIPTTYERFTKSVFEVERQDHLAKSPSQIAQLKVARATLYSPSAQQPKLRSPSEARNEIFQVKQQLQEFNAYKTEHKFLSKRDRLMKTAWKHGVHGFDDADSRTTQCFYKDVKDLKDFAQKEKDLINLRRSNCKC